MGTSPSDDRRMDLFWAPLALWTVGGERGNTAVRTLRSCQARVGRDPNYIQSDCREREDMPNKQTNKQFMHEKKQVNLQDERRRGGSAHFTLFSGFLFSSFPVGKGGGRGAVPVSSSFGPNLLYCGHGRRFNKTQKRPLWLAPPDVCFGSLDRSLARLSPSLKVALTFFKTHSP